MSSQLFAGKHLDAELRGESAVIRFNRPEKRNALTAEMRGDLINAFTQAERDDRVRAIIITGTGQAFCAGGDIEYLRRLKADEDRDGFEKILEEGTRIVRSFRACPKPIVAAINGAAVGGGLILALACDLRCAAESAVLGMPFAKIGMGPDWGGTYLLTATAGSARALELMLTARLISAKEAREWGLLNAVYQDDELMGAIERQVHSMIRFDPDQLASFKRSVYAATEHDPDGALAVERQCQWDFFNHPDFLQRLNRFR